MGLAVAVRVAVMVVVAVAVLVLVAMTVGRLVDVVVGVDVELTVDAVSSCPSVVSSWSTRGIHSILDRREELAHAWHSLPDRRQLQVKRRDRYAWMSMADPGVPLHAPSSCLAPSSWR